jgi:hypothetical protein
MKKFIILTAAIALVCFSIPAMAVDWNFYGSARLETWYDSRDYSDYLNPAAPAGANDTEDAILDWSNESSQRFGANIKAENIKAQVEFSVADQGVSSRRLYGVWDFGAGKMKVGKDYTPVKQFISAQAAFEDLGLLGIGTAYGSRHAQLAFEFGGFNIALVNPSTPQLLTPGGGATFATTAGDTTPILPKLEGAWGMSFDAFNFNLLGGYQYYSIGEVFDGTNYKDVEVTSWIAAGDAGFNFGPAYVKGALSYGENVGNAGWNLGSLWSTAAGGVDVAGLAGGQNISGLAIYDGSSGTDDTTTWMAALVAGLKVSDMMTFEAGFGYRVDDPDNNAWQDTAIYSVYGNATIALAPGVYVIPEISYFNYDKGSFKAANDDAGDQIVIGGKWQIDF